jgi:D-arginine dehydrogenase
LSYRPSYDIIIIGCGIAGASLAYRLTERGVKDILIIEKEEHPGYHATGRAAGVLVAFDLVPSILRLKCLGADFLKNPPEGFSEQALLKRSGILILLKDQLWDQGCHMVPALLNRGVVVEILTPEETLSKMPVVSLGRFDGALYFPENGHLDVNEMLWSYLRHAKRRGTRLHLNEEVRALEITGNRCIGVATDKERYRAAWVVNAGGAWAGKIRELGGPTPIELTPYRRTIITFPAPDGTDVKDWPLTADLSHHYYFSPESSGLLASPMDEDPMEPCDVRPDDLVVAETIERIRAFTPRLVPRFLRSTWAGLRTFAKDQAMVIGEDPILKHFFWLAGQGGSGIETSSVVGQIAADLILERKTGVTDVEAFLPVRFA